MKDLINTNKLDVIFQFGSHVYGTQTEKSDEDFIVIGNIVQKSPGNSNFQWISWDNFQKKLQEYDVSILECVSLLYHKPKMYEVQDQSHIDFILETYQHNWKNPLIKHTALQKLRHSFSQKASNSWVKAKKKCILENEDSYIGIKSLFHSIRILDFGRQIATSELHYIYDFSSCNGIWKNIYEQQDDFLNCKNNEEKYKSLAEPYKKIYNKKHSEFKLVTEKY